jgi:hypothetical protein
VQEKGLSEKRKVPVQDKENKNSHCIVEVVESLKDSPSCAKELLILVMIPVAKKTAGAYANVEMCSR